MTRPAGQNEELCRLLGNLGARVLEIPTIEIAEPVSWQDCDQAIAHMDDYDWLIFTSANAVDAFCGRARGRTLCRVAVVGSQTARRAESFGLQVAIQPRNYRSQGLLDVMPADMHGGRVLLPRGDLADDELPRALRARGATVDAVVVYRTVLPRGGSGPLRNCFETGPPDCVTFTSGSTVRNLVTLVGREDARRYLSRTAIAVIGPVTRRTAEELGIEAAIESPEATIPALVEAIRRYFADRSSTA